MNYFDKIKDNKGKEYYVIDSYEDKNNQDLCETLNDFEILNLLGEGYFGKVYKVVSNKSNKIYAMKVLNTDKLTNEKELKLSLNEITYLKQLNHPHVIKYYKSFENKNLIIIILDFINNGNISKFIESYQILNKNIPEEIVWNLLLQSMSGLRYIHSKGLIHRDIKSDNIFLDNNLKIIIGDLGVSALFKDFGYFKDFTKLKYNNTYVGTDCYMAPELRGTIIEYNEKIDIYSMGVTFYEICYFEKPITLSEYKDMKNDLEKKNVPYSKELLNIINLMLEKDKNKRPNSEEIFNMVKIEYEKKYVKNSSIDSIIRCLYCFKPLTTYFLNIKDINKPIVNAYIDCLKAVNSPNLKIWIKSINNIRQIIEEKNNILEGSKELEPKLVLLYLINNLHNELNEQELINNNNNKYLINLKEIVTNKKELMIEFINTFLTKINSNISNNFMGLIKEIIICNQCQLKRYFFKSYFFITFDLEKIFKTKKIEKLNLEEGFEYSNKNVQIKEHYCPKCLSITEHNYRKFFFSAPNYLIISIQRGINYQYKTPIGINQILDINNYIEFKNVAKKFTLVGVLKRAIKNEKEYYFSIAFIHNVWFRCEGKKIQQSKCPSNDDSNEDIIMLFYQGID